MATSARLYAILNTNSTEHELSCLSVTAQTYDLSRNSSIKNEVSCVTKCETVESKTKKFEVRPLFTQF